MATTTKPQIGPYEWFEAASDGNIDALQRKLGSYIDILNSINHEEQRVTALHAATWSGQARCVEFLLSLHADANCQIGVPGYYGNGIEGDTALHIACRNGNVEIVKQLVGAGTHIKNKEGKTAIEYCKNDEVRQLFQSASVTVPASTATETTTTTDQQPPITITTLEQLHNLVAHDLLSSFSLPPSSTAQLETPSTVLSKATEDGINNLGKQGPTMEASVLMLVSDQLSQTLSALLDQQKVHQANAEKVAVQVEATEKQMAPAQELVQELECKLVQARQLLGETTQANTLAKKQLDDSRNLAATISRNISMVQEKQQALECKLASVRQVLTSLSQKASTRNLLQFNVEDIGCLLRDLGLQNHAERFCTNAVDGEVLLELNTAGLEELGVTERAEQELLFHTREMIKKCGAIRTPSKPAASWDVNEVASWLESQGIPPESVTWFREKGITGISLLSMEAQEISSVPGLPFGLRHKLLKRIEELKASSSGFFHRS